MSARPDTRVRSAARTFAAPAALALATAIGLVSGWLADGWPDVVAWAALAVPLAIVARAVLRR